MITIIAEAGVNHNGSLEMAKRMVDVAVDAGADYVKFQTFKTKNLVTRSARQADYQIKNAESAEKDESQYSMLKRLELSENDHRELLEYCKSKGIKFLSTPFDLESIDLLSSLGLKLWKIPSGEINNYPYLRKIAKYNDEVVMSTGMCEPEDVRLAVKALVDNGQDISKVTLLHCNTQYPTPMQDVNLCAMESLKQFAPNIGYSDHTEGIEVAIAAVALGAKVIEKHFTLSRELPGPDHKASIEPDELKAMVSAIRNVEMALGAKEKHVTLSEMANREVARKSIVASRYIKKGELLTQENMTTKRPGTGISPMLWSKLEGTPAVRDFEPDEIIEI